MIEDQNVVTVVGVYSPSVFLATGDSRLVGDVDLVQACTDEVHLLTLTDCANGAHGRQAELHARRVFGRDTILRRDTMQRLLECGYSAAIDEQQRPRLRDHGGQLLTVADALNRELAQRAVSCV